VKPGVTSTCEPQVRRGHGPHETVQQQHHTITYVGKLESPRPFESFGAGAGAGCWCWVLVLGAGAGAGAGANVGAGGCAGVGADAGAGAGSVSLLCAPAFFCGGVGDSFCSSSKFSIRGFLPTGTDDDSCTSGSISRCAPGPSTVVVVSMLPVRQASRKHAKF
jgi:hypothetical protein